MSSLPSIACLECGHLNEGERIYCHNCGTKLDRSAVITQQQEKEETPEQKQRRVKKLMNPDAGMGKGWWKTGLRAIVLGAMVAALIDILLPPRDVPPMPESLEVSQLGERLETLAIAQPNLRLTLSEAEVNDYLRGTVRMKKAEGWLGKAVTFDRAFVNLEDGSLRVTSQKSVYGYPLYAGMSYRLGVENNALTVTPLGGNVGRLQVPAQAAEYADKLFTPVWDALERERELMNSIGNIEIKEDQIILVSRGTGTAPARPAVAPGAPTPAVPVAPGSLPKPAPASTPASAGFKNAAPGGFNKSGSGFDKPISDPFATDPKP